MNLERAIEIAVNAHAGQTDKSDAPYILHPLRVMQDCDSEVAKTVAVLHDVIEDTPVTEADIREEGFSDTVLLALRRVTKRDGETYPEFIRRVEDDAIAREVKLADIRDNMDLMRLDPPLSEDDLERVQKYHRARTRLEG